MLERTAQNARDDIVVVGLGDLRAVEAPLLQRGQLSEVVDVDFAIDLWRVELRPALPEQRRLFAFSFGQYEQFPAYPLLLGALADPLLELHQFAFAGFDGALGELCIERDMHPSLLRRSS